MPTPRHIAVLGGGLTGLSSAFHLCRRFPSSRITVVEKQNRLGGWVHSERVEVPVSAASSSSRGTLKASLLMEAGPRTLRPNSKAVLELVHLLNISKSLITTSRLSPAAKSRFLHLPERGPGLVPIPSSFGQLLTSSLTPLLCSAVLRDVFLPANNPARTECVDDADESVDAFLTRRFGQEFARVFGSALVHGIYAADSRDLSVRAGFKGVWEVAEKKGWGSVVRGLAKQAGRHPQIQEEHEYEMGDVEQLMNGVAVYSFKDGVQTITRALERWLEERSNVDILRGEAVRSVNISTNGSTFFMVKTTGQFLNPTHIVSCLPLPILHTLLDPSQRPPNLATNKASSVTVLNLAFDRPSSELHPAGFGYLVPRSVKGYEPEDIGILGTVFGSCSLAAQDVVPETSTGVTKMTVMLGGPYLSSSRKPFAENDVAEVLRTVSYQLGLSSYLPVPIYWSAKENHDCIPVLGVGHLHRMRELERALKSHSLGWEGRLEIAGAGVGGVSVGDCVEAGRRVGREW